MATAVGERRTVLLNLPLDVQGLPAAPAAPSRRRPRRRGCPWTTRVSSGSPPRCALPGDRCSSPAGAPGARLPGGPERLGDRCGALLATSAVAKGLFAGSPWALDVSGGFATPLAAELIGAADLVVGWGSTLNMWTMRHGRLIADDAVVVQVDDDGDALGAQRPLTFGVRGDVRAVAEAVAAALPARPPATAPTPSGGRIADRGRWRDVPYDPLVEAGRIDPRTLTMALDDLLPAERTVAVDSGNFMGYPSMFLGVPDEFGFCFTQAFQSDRARPGHRDRRRAGPARTGCRWPRWATAARSWAPRSWRPWSGWASPWWWSSTTTRPTAPRCTTSARPDPLDTVRFPPADIAAVARGFGFEAVTVRGEEDLAAVAAWVDGPAIGAAARPRQGDPRAALLVAGGGVPGPLSGGPTSAAPSAGTVGEDGA